MLTTVKTLNENWYCHGDRISDFQYVDDFHMYRRATRTFPAKIFNSSILIYLYDVNLEKN